VKKVASGVAKKILALLVTVLVLCAILIGVVRELVHQIDDFKPELVAFVNQKTGMYLSIETIKGSWTGLVPRFLVHDISLRAEAGSEPLMSAKTVDFELLLIRSVKNRQPRFRLNIDGAELHAEYKDGRFSLRGFTPDKKQSKEKLEEVVDFIVAQPRIAITNTELSVDGLYAQRVDLHVHQLQSEAGLQRRYLKGYVSASGPGHLSFRLTGRVSGSVFSKSGLSGNVFLDSEATDWLPWIPQQHRSFANAKVESLTGGGRFWVKLKRGALAEIVSDFTANDIKLSSSNDVQPPEIEKLSGKIRWTGRLHDEWKLELQDLNMKTRRFTWRPDRLSLFAQQQTHNSELYRISIDDVDIEPWVKYYLGIQGKDSDIYKTISKLRPSGKVRDLNLELVVEGEKILDYRFALSLAAFENRSWKNYPGFHDVDVQAWGKKGLFIFRLNDDFVELDYPHLFRDALSINKLKGNVSLEINEDGYNLQSDVIQAATPYAQGGLQLSLSLPKDKEISPFIKLQATLRNGDASQASLYLPAGILDDKLVSWLDQAIQAGHLLRGDIIAHGPLRKGTAEKRTVMLGFTGENAVFRFLPDWKEPIRQGLVDVIIDRGAVEAHAVSGTYYDQKIQHATVTLPRYKPSQPHILSVRGKTQGQAQSGFKVLTETPLAGYLGEFIHDFSMTGALDVSLKLDAPLQHKAQPETTPDGEEVVENPGLAVTANIDLSEGSLAIASQGLQVEDLSGEVEFDLDRGLQAHQLTGTLFNGPLVGEITTTRLEQGRQIQLNVAGNGALQKIKEWKPMPVMTAVSGTIDYQFGLYIPMGDMARKHPKYFQVYSNLRGVQVDLPPPFAKPAAVDSVFSLRRTLEDDASELQLKYNDSLSLVLLNSETQLLKGMVRFGPGSVSLPEKNRLVVQGVLAEFDDQKWRASFNRVPKASENKTEQFDSSALKMVDDTALRIEQLRIAGTDYGRADISVRRTERGWKTWLDNSRVSGVADLPLYLLESAKQLPRQKQPVNVTLTRVHIPKSEDQEQETDWTPMDLSPRLFPPVNININELKVGDADFGRWDLKLIPSEQGMDITQLNCTTQSLSLTGTGQWHESAKGNRFTRVSAQVKGENAADIMRIWGATPTLSSKSATADLQLGWPGAPIEMAVSRLRGDIKAELEDGIFFNVSSNAAGKLWGALNFETLMRRLQLNFDDLRESDMVYDEITGDFNLNQGLLEIKSMHIDSPSIKMSVSGKLDMEPGVLDMGLDVTLPVTRNLILPAAVIGGVPAAATAFVVEKMLGSQFDKLTTIKYAVQGTIDEPRISVKDSFSIIPKQVGEAVLGNEKPAADKAPQVRQERSAGAGDRPLFTPPAAEPTPNLYQTPAPQKAP